MLQPGKAEYTDLRNDFDGEFTRMSRAKSPTYVMRRGKATAVVVNAKRFKAYEEALEERLALEAIEQSRAQSAAALDRSAKSSRKSLEKELGVSKRRVSRRTPR